MADAEMGGCAVRCACVLCPVFLWFVFSAKCQVQIKLIFMSTCILSNIYCIHMYMCNLHIPGHITIITPHI